VPRRKQKVSMYEIRIIREVRLSAVFEVEAASETEAHAKAVDLAKEAYDDAWQEDALIDERVHTVRPL
jgi:hypothetical protein